MVADREPCSRGEVATPEARGAGAERGGAVEEGDGARRGARSRGARVTVAVKVTDWPKTEGLVADVTDALVASWLTVWVRLGWRCWS